MADSVRELIVKNLLAALQTIQTVNGYENTLATVERYSQHGNHMLNIPAVVISEASEDNAYPTVNLTSCRMTIFLALATRQAETDSTPAGTVLNSLLADVKKAVRVDYTRGGYAVDTQFKTVQPYEVDEGNPHIGLLIEIEIHYRHRTNNPATAG